ncbi:MCE family protein [Gordonia sp. ABSL49_1]|uniref:MCE family protein n=1 Tax=unclassified Gordonia (in: high G+C Gram-positive bacteria) TaxID=2657482 RepID=UPI001F0F5D5C|nr:MlaD family protein [Gordonia sp. ABSL49_1]MCH5641970.1 MCE family protein [Gordonia sp. ABSL49_1]
MTRLSWVTVVKSMSFVIIGIIAAVIVSNTLRVPVSGPTTTYNIQFTDAEGLLEGNPVTMSGVRIGRVKKIEFSPQPDGTALADVEVDIQQDVKLPQQVHASIRYGDMLGARYIALSQARPGQPGRNGTDIPVDATSAPVNLTALMNGFQPLFSALDPKQVNELARGFVDTFEGRQGSVQLLLKQIGSMGSNLSANSAIFAQLVTNLNELMGTMDSHNPQLTQLFNGLSSLTSAVVGDSGQFAALLTSGDRAVSSLAQMMTSAGGNFQQALTGLEGVTSTWVAHTPQFTTFLKQFPVLAQKINQSGRYGGFMMLYLCNFTLKAFNLEANIFGPQHSPVCM